MEPPPPQKKRALHLGSVVHNMLNMRHKGLRPAFNGELARIRIGIRLQQLVRQT